MAQKKILIIEDDADTATGLSVRLRANGYDTAFAPDGVTAISMARKEHPDLIILDLGLPAGDGFSVLKRLQSLAPTAHIPVVVLTARDPAVSKQRALDMGAAAFFQKPADDAQLLEAIRKELSEKETVETMGGGRRKILIIEDDADTATGLSVRLRANGYDTVFATDGASAIAAANNEHPDLIILDLGLPAGDGFFVLKSLQSLASTAHIPVVVLTARDPAVTKQRALDMGAAAFFQKPADNAQLLEAIRKELSEKETVEAMEGGERKILIIEDDADFRKALNIRLRAHNYETAFASDAFAAMTEARKFRPHLILLDLGLPAGDGLVVLDHLKKTAEFARIPVIIVTGRELRITEKAALLEKAFAYFLKPVDHEALLDAIRKALE